MNNQPIEEDIDDEESNERESNETLIQASFSFCTHIYYWHKFCQNLK
ncbi:hypothetical protein [Candidatus Parabeggiatoa sp. HSG14]